MIHYYTRERRITGWGGRKESRRDHWLLLLSGSLTPGIGERVGGWVDGFVLLLSDDTYVLGIWLGIWHAMNGATGEIDLITFGRR